MENNALVDRLTTFIILILSVISLILSVSVVEGRIQDLQNKQANLQALNQQISTLTSIPPDAQSLNDLNSKLQRLQKDADTAQAQIDGADGTIAWGSNTAWGQIGNNLLQNPANYFHALSSETNLIFIGLLACMIAYAAGRMYLNQVVTLHDLGLSSLTGLIAVLAIRGGRSFMGDQTEPGVDITNPYGIALFSALAGLYIDKFYHFLSHVLGSILVQENKVNDAIDPNTKPAGLARPAKDENEATGGANPRGVDPFR